MFFPKYGKYKLLNLFNSDKYELDKVKQLLKNYITKMYSERFGLIIEKETISSTKIIHYHDLKIKYNTDFIKFFPYSDIKIIENIDKFTIVATEDYPSSKEIEIKDINKFTENIKNKLNEFENNKDMADDAIILKNDILSFYNSFSEINEALGILFKIPKKINKILNKK
jgi:hypothetical protein